MSDINIELRLMLRNIRKVIVPILFPIVLLGFFSVIIIQGEINTEIQNKNLQILQQITESIESVFGTVNHIASNFDTNAINQQKLKLLLNRSPEVKLTKDEYDNIAYFSDVLFSYQINNIYIHSIYLYMNNPYDRYFSSNGIVPGSERLKEVFLRIDSKDTYYFGSQTIQQFESRSDMIECIVVGRQILNTSYSRTKTGIVVIYFRKPMINELLKEYLKTNDSALYLLNKDGSVLAGYSRIEGMSPGSVPTQIAANNGVHEIASSNKKYLCFVDKSESFGISLVFLRSRDVLYKHSQELLMIAVGLALLSVLTAIAISYYFARKNNQQLSMVLSIIQKANRDEPIPVIEKNPKNEYEYVLQNMISVFVQKNNLKVQLMEKKYAMRTMEMEILQSQINPHFLYNTLKTIYWKSVSLTSGTNEVSRMIENLSDVLYFVLSVPGYLVELSQEIKYAQSYLGIQRLRYSDKFTVIWNYNEELLKAKIIKMLLQPIIENSIVHGIAHGKKEKYKIKISIWKEINSMHLRITDNGEGMERDQLREVRKRIEELPETRQHIGLLNVKRRLINIYNKDDTGLSISSKPGYGTSVHIFFPYSES